MNNTRKERKFEHREGYLRAVYSVPLLSHLFQQPEKKHLLHDFEGNIPSLPGLYAEADFVAIKKQEGVGRAKVVLYIYDHTHLNSYHKYT